MNRPSIDGTPTKPIADIGSDVPAVLLYAGLDQIMLEMLRPITGGLGVLCALFALNHLISLPSDIRWSMVIIAVLTSSIFLGAYFYLKEHSIPARQAAPLIACIGGILLLNPIIHMYLSKQPEQTTYFILFILGVGSLILSSSWFIAMVAMAWVTWGGVFVALPTVDGWANYIYSLLAATGLATIIFIVRLRSALRLERFRLRGEGYKLELEGVLKATDEAQRSLATSMAIGQSITSKLDLDVLLPAVAEIIQLRFSCEFVGIFLLDETGQYAVCRAGTGEVGKKLTQQAFRLKVGQEGIVGWVAEKRRPSRVNDVLQDERYIPLGDGVSVRSVLALPLEMGTNMLGVLDMESKRIAAFTEEHLPFMQLLADQVATAINNASLYQREKTSRQLTENLYRIGRELSGTLDLSKVLQVILEYLSEIVHYDRAAVLLHLSEGDEMEIVAEYGFPEGHEGTRITVRENDVFDEVYRTRQPLSISDVQERSDWTQLEEIPLARSWLGIPLIHADEVMGMLSLTREVHRPYRKDEVTLAATFAGQAAIALHNARLYEQITRFNQDLEELVEQRTEALQTAYDRLERLDQAKSKFISIASHELRTPLTLLKGYNQMMLENVIITGNEKLFSMSKGMEAGAKRLHEIIDSMLDVAKIDNQELQLTLTPVLIPVLLHFVHNSFKSTLEERRLKFVEDYQALPTIQGDLENLRKVFYHLVINAIKYTPDGGTITLSGRTLDVGEFGMVEGGVEIVVSDTGIGIDTSATDLIFAKFYQTGEVALHSSGKSKYKGGGPGLGLAIAKGIITAHGGKIWAESSGYDEKTCPGSHFHVVLPIQPKSL